MGGVSGKGAFGSGGGIFGLPDFLDLHGNKAKWQQEEFEAEQAAQKQILDNPELDPQTTTKVVSEEATIQLPTTTATPTATEVDKTKVGGLQL